MADSSFSERFRRFRVGVLLLVLLGVIAWSASEWHWREQRRSWQQTIPVEIFFLRHGPISDRSVDALRNGIPRLEARLHEERQRYRPGAPRPFSFLVHLPIDIATVPPEPPPDQDIAARAQYYFELRKYLADIHQRTSATPAYRTLAMYVVLEPIHTRERFAEGFGTLNGTIGVVRTVVDERTVDLSLVALAHELMHCFGASDKYDEQGHAMEPSGIAEPERFPWYPQRFGDVMVGEIPLDTGRGRLLTTLRELRVGPSTASEIGWSTH